MKSFKIPCVFGNNIRPYEIYIGTPDDEYKDDPLHYQEKYLTNVGGSFPEEFKESLKKLVEISHKHEEISLEDLCSYAFDNNKEVA